VAYLPVIAYNLAGPADTLAQAAASRNVETDLGPVSYTVNLAQSLAQLGRSLAGGFDGHEQPIWGTGALLVALVALSLTVLAGLARQPEVTGRRLPAVVSVVTLLLLPAVNQNWHGFLEARYLGLLAPLVAVAGGVATTAATDPARRAAAIAAGLLIAVSGARSWRHVDAALSAGNPIAEMLEVVAIAGRTSSGDGGGSAGSTQDEDAPAPILVAEELEDLRWPHRGDPARAITYYLTLAGVPYEAESLERIGQLVAHDAARAVIAARPDADALRLAPMVTVREEGIGEWGIYSMASGAPRGPATTP
jgi:hypothetical protein